MENPQNSVLRAVRFVLFGIAIGFIPGMIRVQQLDRQIEAERADAAKLNEGLRAAIVDEKKKHDADREGCQKLVSSESGYTVLLDLNHPWGIAPGASFGGVLQVESVTLALPPGNPVRTNPYGPMWVIPRIITPHVMDGILGAAYTHIWPSGHTDGWQMAGRAE